MNLHEKHLVIKDQNTPLESARKVCVHNLPKSIDKV